MAQVKTISLIEAFKTLELPELDRNLFSSREWLSVLIETYKLKLYVKYIEEDGKVASYIVYSIVHNFLEWKICICSYCDYCDCYVQSPEHWHEFFLSIRKDFPEYRIAIRNLRDETVRNCPDFKFLSKEYFHIVDVRPDIETLWKKLYPNFRGACQQAVKRGVTVRRGGKTELKKFFDLHLKLRKTKYRLFPQPYRFFDNIWEEYMAKDKGVLLGAYDKNGRFIAANVYLICGNTLYYKFATSSLEKLDCRPNNLLIWHGIQFAKERNLEFVDLGSSGFHQDSLVWFKSHISEMTTKMEITHWGYAPPKYKFSRKAILGLMTELFTLPWMPNFLVRFGSNIIYWYLA